MATERPSRGTAEIAAEKKSLERRAKQLSSNESRAVTRARKKSVAGAASLQSAHGQLFRKATEVMGRGEIAMRWMGTPVGALNFATPISLLHTESGVKAVWAALGRLEHGVL